MNKLAIFLTLLGVSALATCKLLDYCGDAPDGTASVVSNDNELQEQWMRYQVFKQTLDDTVGKLGAREINLRQAYLRVQTIATEYFPEYLVNLHQWEEGDTEEERIVRNLVGHVHEECPPPSHVGLDVEMNSYLSELRRK